MGWGMGTGGSPELMTGVVGARKVWRRDVSSPEMIEGLDGGWDVSSQGVLVSKAWEVWRRDVSRPEVIESLDRGWDVSSQKVFGCEGGRGIG